MCPFYVFQKWNWRVKRYLKECFKVLAEWMTDCPTWNDTNQKRSSRPWNFFFDPVGRVFFLVLYNPPILALSVWQKHQHYLMEMLFWIRFSPALFFCNNNIYDHEIMTDHKSGGDNDLMLTLDDIEFIISDNIGHLIIGNHIKWHGTIRMYV